VVIDSLLYLNLAAVLKNTYFRFHSLRPNEQATFNQISEVRITVRRTSLFFIFPVSFIRIAYTTLPATHHPKL
jgi:hypothetical protein